MSPKGEPEINVTVPLRTFILDIAEKTVEKAIPKFLEISDARTKASLNAHLLDCQGQRTVEMRAHLSERVVDAQERKLQRDMIKSDHEEERKIDAAVTLRISKGAWARWVGKGAGAGVFAVVVWESVKHLLEKL